MAPPNPPSSEPLGAAPPDDLAGWMEQYAPALRRYFMKKVSAAEAEDLVQDVFVKMQARGSLAPVENVEGYLFRTAANVLVSYHRREAVQGRDRTSPLEDWHEPREEISPERVLIGKQAVERVIVALNELPARSRQAFLLHRFEEMTAPAIAVRMGVSVKAVEALLTRAMKRIGAAVKGWP